MEIIPKIIRLKDAPSYLGMNKNYFNRAVRPYLTEIPIGDRGIGFDRLELDRWVVYTKQSSGRPPTRRILWDANNEQPSLAYAGETGSGMLRKQLKEKEFTKALERVTSRKPSNT